MISKLPMDLQHTRCNITTAEGISHNEKTAARLRHHPGSFKTKRDIKTPRASSATKSIAEASSSQAQNSHQIQPMHPSALAATIKPKLPPNISRTQQLNPFPPLIQTKSIHQPPPEDNRHTQHIHPTSENPTSNRRSPSPSPSPHTLPNAQSTDPILAPRKGHLHHPLRVPESDYT
ncbi:uncharacterized protein BO97DRAFT_260344 [Aspergillus homomorphus CBS 101889]|uniref:Uncharacterized protein n=1 Tax=Aspergillus homomorphus (strain CBS 101889) TaxID=1450537 RepID=A0A395I499_ASPHC|nr:hypothetical protein BO97DRAFT_260344 [Aspergillus homomorphus CBS 101889]RAL14910.1 hypothetical protein BO97DRAFT_260344 [Aspergillus homomorphus CBS 101889]